MSALNDLGIPYALGGALAVNTWVGRERIRPTLDLDFHAAVSDEQLERFRAGLRAAGVETLRGPDLRFPSGSVLLRRLVCPPETTIDLLAAGDPYGAEALRRRVPLRFESLDAFVLAPEDLILHKALAGRDRDWIDIEHLAESLGDELDREYMESWARRLRVWSKLKRRLGRRPP